MGKERWVGTDLGRAVVVLLFSVAAPFAALAEEPRLPPVDRSSFEGEWEGGWSERSGNLYVALLTFGASRRASTVTIATGTVRPLLFTFTITEASFANGTVKMEAAGTGSEAGHRLYLSGEGWADKDDGFVKLAIEKRTNAGEPLFRWDAVLHKAPGGFLRSAARLLQFTRANRRSAR